MGWTASSGPYFDEGDRRLIDGRRAKDEVHPGGKLDASFGQPHPKRLLGPGEP